VHLLKTPQTRFFHALARVSSTPSVRRFQAIVGVDIRDVKAVAHSDRVDETSILVCEVL
jgi:hypothetical protein